MRSNSGSTAVLCGILALALIVAGLFAEKVTVAGESGVTILSVRSRDEPAARPKYTPTERMARARLKSAHDDVQRIRKTRHKLSPLPGLNDYRAILHAHAEDSAHTGGTRPEMLAEARSAGVDAILLTDHHRPPRDFISDSWRGLREGVLFLPGSEAGGFLLYPSRSIMNHMNDASPALIEATRVDGGLIFLSHIEERPRHSMAGLDGMEIYNRHADAKKDAAGLRAIMLRLTAPESLRQFEADLKSYPDELFAAEVEYPADYLVKWDAETSTRRLTGVAANDCHHNFILTVKMVDDETVKVGTNVDSDDQMRSISARVSPGIRELTEGHRRGDILARIDLDPYSRSFKNVSTHLFAPELSEPAVRGALREGHAYVSHDWMCDPTGFWFGLFTKAPAVDSPERATKPQAILGDQVKFSSGSRLVAQFPAPCHVRLMSAGKVIALRSGDRLEFDLKAPGVYRVEGWLELGGEERGWVYSNPIYVR